MSNVAGGPSRKFCYVRLSLAILGFTLVVLYFVFHVTNSASTGPSKVFLFVLLIGIVCLIWPALDALTSERDRKSSFLRSTGVVAVCLLMSYSLPLIAAVTFGSETLWPVPQYLFPSMSLDHVFNGYGIMAVLILWLLAVLLFGLFARHVAARLTIPLAIAAIATITVIMHLMFMAFGIPFELEWL